MTLIAGPTSARCWPGCGNMPTPSCCWPPAPADPGSFPAGMGASLKADAPDTTQALGELGRVGLLVRRGRSLRVVPDVLADHVVASACLTPQGAATGFADRVFSEFAGDCLSQ